MTLQLPRGDIFRYLPDHKVLLCVPCGYAVQPQAITSHLQRKEHHDLNRKDRQALRAHALTHNLANPEDVRAPDAGVTAIPGLRPMRGYACGFCSHLTANIYSLKEHGRREHDKRRCDGVYWREVKMQTFFRGNQMRYFIVNSADGTIPDNPVLLEAPQSSIHGDGNTELGIKEKPDGTNHMEMTGTIDGLTDTPEPSTLVPEGLGGGPTKDLKAPPNYSVMSTLDPESNVLTFHPSLEEFRDFPKFLTEALAASRADPDSHVGVCVVKVPQGGLYSSGPAGIARSQNSRCLQYFEQTSKVLDPNTSGVFRINHVTKGPATIAQWQKLVGGVMREHGNMVGDGRMDDLLSQESLKAVYVSNTAAKSISSLFDMDPIGLSELPGNQLQHLEIPGMSSDYIYLGAPGSLFTMHLEDYNVHSFNYLRSGEPKRWVVVNPGSRTKFENVIKATFPTIPAACSQFMRHQNLYMSPDFLRRHSIAFAEVTQTPGDMLVLFPFAYHQGYNTGENLALASNYALESEELLYERGYLPCGGECCPGQVPLVLEFPLKLQKVKEPEVVVPGSKRKVCSGREIADSTVPRKRGRPKKIIISLGEDALTAPEYNELKMVKTSKMGSGGASAVPNVPMLSPPAARKRGRPPKAKVSETDSSIAPKRGRPKKVEVSQMSGGSAPTGLHAGVSPTPPKRGRPRKMKVPEVAPSTTPNSAPTASRELAVPKTINAPNTPAGSGEPSEPSAPKPLSTSSEPTETTTDSAPTARKRGRPKKARVQEINDGGVSPPSDTAPTASNDLVVPNAPTAPNEQVATSDPNEVDMPTEPGTLATTSAPIATNASTGPNNVTEPDAPATTNAPIATNASTGPNNVTEPDAPATTNASIVINAPIESNNVTEPDAPTTTNASIAINAPTESNNVTEPNAPATTNGPIATNASTELNNVTELNAPATTNGLIATNASTELNNVTEPNAPATTNGPIAISVPTESNDVIKPVVPSEPSTRKRGRPKGAKTLEAGGGAAPVTRKRGRPPKAEANPPVEGKDVPAALEYESPTELKVHI